MRRFLLLLLCCSVFKASFAYEVRFIAVNVGKEHLECFFDSGIMADGYPAYPPAGDTSFMAGETKDYAAAFTSGRMAVRFAVYKSGKYLGRFGGWANGRSETFVKFYAFSGDTTNGTLRSWDTYDPRPPLPPSNSVPVGWPNGQATSLNGLQQVQNYGSYLWDGDGFEFYNPFLDGTQEPPADLLPAGQEWKFGFRTGGPVFAPNADIPEWYSDYQNGLVPTDWVDSNGMPVLDIPEDFDGDGIIDLSEATAERLDFWGRKLADLGATRNGIITDINGNVLGIKADLVEGLDRLESVTESTSASQVHATQSATSAIQDGSANIVQAVAQNAQTVKEAIEEAFGEGSYAGYGDLVDLDDWSNLDADIYQTGVDTNFRSAVISPSIASSDYNIVSGDGDNFISGLGNSVSVAVGTLLEGVSDFLDPFKAIGKVESLTVTIYQKPMVIDFGPYKSVIDVVRAIAVLCVYYLSFCSVRSAVFMIFGGA